MAASRAPLPGVIAFSLLTIGAVAAAAFAFHRLGTAVAYADAVRAEAAVMRDENAVLRQRMKDYDTLAALERKAAASKISPFQTADWIAYSSSNLSLKYPEGFEAVKATSAFPGLVIKGKGGRVEIFRARDFEENRIGKIEPQDTQAELDERFPKQMAFAGSKSDSRIAPYNVWVYYAAGDTETKELLDAIVSSIEVAR